jgi:hypothetical protein
MRSDITEIQQLEEYSLYLSDQVKSERLEMFIPAGRIKRADQLLNVDTAGECRHPHAWPLIRMLGQLSYVRIPIVLAQVRPHLPLT